MEIKRTLRGKEECQEEEINIAKSEDTLDILRVGEGEQGRRKENAIEGDAGSSLAAAAAAAASGVGR